MSGGKLPLTVENVMAEKDKVADAAAAEAISAVVQNAPSVSASSQGDAGFERQPVVELEKQDKEAKVEDVPSPKSSEPDLEMADPIPVTETEMVGDLIQDQEAQDKAQFVFSSEADADMEKVSEQLDGLTKHIKALSVGEDPTGDQAQQHGPQPDQPTMVAVERAGDGLFRLTCFPEPFPHVSRMVANLLTGLTVKEVAQLFDLFKGKVLTRAGVERALECYVITKRRKDHEKPLRRPYNLAKSKHGIGYSDMNIADAGEPMEWICPQCMTPRPQSKPNACSASRRKPLPTARSPQPACVCGWCQLGTTFWWSGPEYHIGMHLGSQLSRRKQPPLM